MKKRTSFIFPVMLAMILVFSLLAGCGEDPAADPVVTMSLNYAERQLAVGPGATSNQSSVTLRATVREDDVTKSDAVIEWSSSDPTKATVNGGVVTAVAAGTATITAKYGELSEDCVITIEYLELITLNETGATLYIHASGAETFQIVAEVTGGGTVAYESQNAEVATVDANGLVTGVGSGTTTVKVTSAGAADKTCSIVVIDLTAPYSFNSGNFATVRSNAGIWHWFTQSANIGSTFKLNQANFDPLSKTLRIDFDAIVDGWEEGVVGVKEYAFRIQPLLTENIAENIDISYTFTAKFVSDRDGKIAIYDRDFGMYVPDHVGYMTEDPLMTLDDAKAQGLSVTREVAAAAKGVDLEEQDLVKWYEVKAGVEVEIEFKGKLSTDGTLVVRPYMYSDFDALYPNAEGEVLGEMVDDPFYVMLQNMTFTVGENEVDYRTGKVVEAAPQAD